MLNVFIFDVKLLSNSDKSMNCLQVFPTEITICIARHNRHHIRPGICALWSSYCTVNRTICADTAGGARDIQTARQTDRRTNRSKCRAPPAFGRLIIIQCESKIFLSRWGFLKKNSQRVRIFKQNFTCLLYVHIYGKSQNFIQLSPSLTKLCHIKRNHPVNFHFSLEFELFNPLT